MNTLPKEERLFGIKLITGFYQSSSSFLCYPYKVSWQLNTATVPAKVLFSVSKKRYKKAVDRNLLKRRMRECYRLQKQELLFLPLKTVSQQLIFSITYIGKEIIDSGLMMQKMQKVLQQLAEKLV